MSTEVLQWRWESKSGNWSVWMDSKEACIACASSDTGTGRILERVRPEPKPVTIERVAGFTMVELCIVVVIIGILAAIAIPNFQAMQDNAKVASLKHNMHNLQLAGESYATWNEGSYTGDAAVLMASDSAPTFRNPWTGQEGAGLAWQAVARRGEAPSIIGCVGYGGDADGFWVHGLTKSGAVVGPLMAGEVLRDEAPIGPDPNGGGPVQ